MAEVIKRQGFFPRLDIRHPLSTMAGIGGIRLNVTDAPPRQESRTGGVMAPERPTPTPTLPRPDRQPPVPEPRPSKPKHTGRNAILVFSGLSILTATTVWGSRKFLNDAEPTPQTASQTQNIDSIPNFSDIKIAGRKAAIEKNEKNGDYEMTPPSNRQPESLSDIPTTTTVQDIPHIPESDTLTKETNLKWGLSGFLESRQVLMLSKDQQATHKEIIPPSATINGYIVAKEKQQDGSIMFAIELPYLDSPRDILSKNAESSNPQVKQKEWRSANLPSTPEIQIGGTIVWIRAYEGKNPSYAPFNTDAINRKFIKDTDSKGRPGSGYEPLAEYSQIGDFMGANISLDPSLGMNPESLDKLLQGYAELYGTSAEAAREKLTAVTESNLNNSRKLLEDAKTRKEIPLSEQVEGKRYTFTAGSIAFIPK